MGRKGLKSLKGMFSLLLIVVVLGVLAGAVIWWKRSGGVKLEVGYDPSIDLTPQQIRKIEEIRQRNFKSKIYL